MTKKITLKEIGEMLAHVVKHMATKDDLKVGLGRLRTELKADIFSLQTQVNSIESQVRGMNHARLEMRVMDLEEKVLRKAR